MIVVVDDRATNRAIFSRLASSIASGADIVTCSTPFEVLDLLARQAPDLIITDYKMPGLDGAEFVRRIRTSGPGADVPVIVITAYDDRAFRLRALEAGATDFLRTPVDHQEFVTRGRNILKLGQQQKIIRFRANELQRELTRSEESLEITIRDSRHRLLQVIDTIPALISASDADGRLVFENKHSATASPLLGLPDGRDGQILRGEVPMLRYEEDATSPDGPSRTFLTCKYPLHNASGTISHVLTTSFDISERKQAEKEIAHLAHHDTLTGLVNRLLLSSILERELARPEDGSFALHLIDLDRFKSINDGFGHDQGDALLREIAGRLRQEVGEDDVVARLGGDEFAILQRLPVNRNATSQETASQLAGRVLRAVSKPFPIESYRASIGASIGVTVAPADARTPEELLKTADLAMYRAKHEGRGCVRFFSSEMRTIARDNVLLEIELRQGIGRGELVLHYQPQVDVRTGLVVGTESLLRWERPGHGLLAPGDFLPMAEASGLIPTLDRWALWDAARQAASWAAAGTPVVTGVNLSAATLKEESVLRLVRTVLDRTGLDPALLELELTEGALMRSQHNLAIELQALREMGVRIAVDDFGTGYSSLAYLQRLPVDRLKIDKSFVQDVPREPDGFAIVRAIVGIGHSLRMEVLAEGVETTGQLERLRDNGCYIAQGFLLGEPVPAERFHRLNQTAGEDHIAGTLPAG